MVLKSTEKVSMNSSNEATKVQKSINQNSSRAPKFQRGNYEDWHVQMGHLNDAALAHMPKVIRGCQITSRPS